MSLLQRLAGAALVRRTGDALFRLYAGRRVARLDALDLEATQQQTLFRLLRLARNTRFGRDHQFERIRTVAAYREHVPLRDYEAFWKCYWQPAFPHLRDATWPGVVPYLALSSGTTSGTFSGVGTTSGD